MALSQCSWDKGYVHTISDRAVLINEQRPYSVWFSVANPGGGSGSFDPPPPLNQTWRLIDTEILTSTGPYITFWLAGFFNETPVAFCHLTKFQGYYKMWFFSDTLLWSVHLWSQSSISRANGDRRLQIEKHVVLSVRSNLPRKVQQSFLNQSFHKK